MRYLVTLFIVFSIAFTSQSQTKIPVKKVTIFKNSTCMMVKEGSVKTQGGQLTMPIPEKALMGTYWISGSKDNPVKSILFKTDTTWVSKPAKNISEMLNANIGKEVSLILSSGEKNEKAIDGKIISFFPETETVRIAVSGGKTAIIPASLIMYIEFPGELNNKFHKDSIYRSATVLFDKKNENAQIQETYMQQGVNWIPSYFLKLVNDKDAKLEMKAVVENMEEDLDNVETEVVVGSPQLFFGLQLDPITYPGLANLVLSSIYSRYDNNILGNAWTTQAQAPARGMLYEEDQESGYDNSGFLTDGEKNNDLYIYKLGKISLPKGGKGQFPVFSINLDYKDKYEANIPDQVNYASNQYCSDEEQTTDVFHSLEITNSSEVPFTTAPIMVIDQNNRFLAQDRLRYTPTGAITAVKLSKAIDILLKNSEEELSRTDNVKKVGRTTYSKAVLKGSIQIENHQQKAVDITISKSLNGTVSSAEGAKITKLKSYNSINPVNDIKWDIKLAAGEKKKITYQYEVFFIGY